MKETNSRSKRTQIGTAEKSDRTLEIPDEIIHRFLSLVDVRTAVQTCVLSRKWRNIWVSLPFLNFLPSKFTSLDSYRKFVNEFLIHRKDKSNITSIAIDLYEFHTHEVKSVIQFAMDRSVEKIEMSYLDFDDFSGALKFEFLKSLCLRGCTVSLKDLNCPALETLHLLDTAGYSYDNDSYEDDSYEDVPILNLERFHRLEILTLEKCGTTDEDIEIRSNTISQLNLLDVGVGKLLICTPNLSSFNFISPRLPKFTFLDGLPSLERAHIDLHMDKDIWKDLGYYYRELQIEYTIKLLRTISEAEFITVSQETVNVLAAASNLSKYQPPCFRRLKSINLPRQFLTEDQRPSKSPDQLIRYLVNGSRDPNIYVQDRWMRIQKYKPREHIFVSDDLCGYSVLTSLESIASKKHVQVQSYIKERIREVVKREAELSRREVEIATQEARLKMERENLEKEKTILLRTASSPDKHDEVLGLTPLESNIQEMKSKKDTLKTRAESVKTATRVGGTLGYVGTSSSLSSFGKMEEKDVEDWSDLPLMEETFRTEAYNNNN